MCALLKRDMSIINDEDDASNTPLHLAALYGNDKVAEELLERGAAIDARSVKHCGLKTFFLQEYLYMIKKHLIVIFKIWRTKSYYRFHPPT